MMAAILLSAVAAQGQEPATTVFTAEYHAPVYLQVSVPGAGTAGESMVLEMMVDIQTATMISITAQGRPRRADVM
jgi:hypothetical protein